MNLAASNVISAQFYCKQTDQVSINIFHYLVASVGPTPATDDDAANTLSTLLAPDFKALIENMASYQGCQVRIINVLPLPSGALSANGAGAGTAGAIGLPRQTAGLIGWRTGFAGPGHRGRLYLPFPSSTDNDSAGEATAGYVTRVQTLAADLSGPILVTVAGRTATLDPVIWSRKFNTYYPITEFTTTQKWATIRRRGSFGRPNTGPF